MGVSVMQTTLKRAAVMCGLSALMCAAIPLSVAGGVGATRPLAQASDQVSSIWSSQEADAIAAISNHTGSSPTGVGSLSSVEDSNFTSTSGQAVQVEERTFAATIQGLPSAVTLSLLNSTQLIVGYVTFGSTFEATSLVLEPGTSSISGSYNSTAEGVAVPTTEAAITTRDKSARVTASEALLTRQSASEAFETGRPHSARLDTFVYAGGCEEYLDTPGQEGTIYGELVYGIAGFVNQSCNASTAVLAGLNFGTTQLNDVNGASGNPANGGYGTTAYWPCYASGSYFYAWYTRVLYEVNSVYYGYTQGPSFL